MVRGGVVQTVFYTELPMSAYPDIEAFLMEVPDEVQCNWLYVNGEFITNYTPEEPI